ncbi:class I SAM-dependent methyltransferase [Pseudomonas sp. CFBP 8771]|uniref:class I SAM-dependent methyltransferase n=1 Tax=Pseudomonas sp. CFBP 8771 TaxID=2775285 RepID=UPI00178530FA|nr:class I SAM-dependent methyltransferase [Pseudomonas sp. CFBP 8771]MBD8601581.1 class I SAM-dependent methyltransferase [Pseudomonas sp. CFBP 8771]
MLLDEIYAQHTGRVSDKWQSYLHHYDRLLSPIRHKPISILEIGIQNGGSLEIWDQYFPNATSISGCDINEKCASITYDSTKINIVIGDIKKQDTQNKILEISQSFDVIIDDGSHTSLDIIQTFSDMFAHIKEGGIFIAEDLHCSYWADWEGGLNYPLSAMAFFKKLADIINFEHWQVRQTRTEYLAAYDLTPALSEALLSEIHSIEFVNSICIIKRKHASQNSLGHRNVAGLHEQVVSIKASGGTLSSPPDLSTADYSTKMKLLEASRQHTASQLRLIEVEIEALQEANNPTI